MVKILFLNTGIRQGSVSASHWRSNNLLPLCGMAVRRVRHYWRTPETVGCHLLLLCKQDTKESFNQVPL